MIGPAIAVRLPINPSTALIGPGRLPINLTIPSIKVNQLTKFTESI
jgi:hypothetical protein